MKVTVNSKDLSKALSIVMPAIGANPVLPILEDVLVEVSENEMKLIGTDLDLRICTTVECKHDVGFSTAIPAKPLLDVVKKLPNQPLTMQVKDSKIYIKSAFGKYSLPVEDSSDYPKGLQLEDCEPQTIDASEFTRAIECTVFMTSND